ncbi:AfsA-related hotdog domain-containing protein [Arthrobacter cupressi]
MDGRITRTLVHKASEDAVLIGPARSIDGHHWEFEARLPRDPSAPDTAGIPTILGLELMRQTAIAYSHLQGGVPLEWALLMNELSFGWLRDIPGDTVGPFTGHVTVSTLAEDRRKGLVSGLELEAALLAEGAMLGTGRGRLSCLSPTAYRAIRRNAPAVDRTAGSSLRCGLADVGRRGNALRGALAWNWDDPLIFDHFSDHLPGMLLARGMLDAHLALTGSEAARLDITCKNFGEFNAPAEVSAVQTAAAETHVSISQLGRTLATGICRGLRPNSAAFPLLTLDSPHA